MPSAASKDFCSDFCYKDMYIRLRALVNLNVDKSE